METRTLDDLARRLADAVPGAQALKDDLERRFRATLEAAFDRLDVVTRDDIQVQMEVLTRAREQIKALEERVAALEARVGDQETPPQS